MAVNTRLTAPNYRIFEPDALDVALSQKVLDPLQGGIAGAMLLSHGTDQSAAQQQFLDRTDKFNEMARGLDAMEIAQKSQAERMKLAPGLLEHGTNASDILGISDILTPNGIRSNDAATLFGDKTRAEIAAALATAAHSGDGTKETTTVTRTDTGGMNSVAHKYAGGPRPEDSQVAQPDLTTSTPPTNTPTALNQQALIARRQAVVRGLAAVGAASQADASGSVDPATGSIVITNNKTGAKATVDVSGKVERH